jgi:hypothetical protein
MSNLKDILKPYVSSGKTIRLVIGVLGDGRTHSANRSAKGSRKTTSKGQARTTREIAIFNANGTASIPARPFLTKFFTERKTEVEKTLNSWFRYVFDGKDPVVAAKMIGEVLVGKIKAFIPQGGFAPNAASTIKRKGSSTPLIDKGQLRQSISYKVE